MGDHIHHHGYPEIDEDKEEFLTEFTEWGRVAIGKNGSREAAKRNRECDIMNRWTIFVGLVVMVCLAGCRHLSDESTSHGKVTVAEKVADEPAEDIAIYHSLVNFVFREYLIKKDGTSRFEDPVLLLLPYKFRRGYVPDVPGVKVVVGERSDMGNFKTVVTVRNVKQTDYGFSIEVVRNPHVSLGSSGLNYFLEKTPSGWRRVNPKGNETPIGWKS